MDEIKKYIVAAMIVDGIKSAHRIDISNDLQALARVIEESEKALIRHRLDRNSILHINLPFISSYEGRSIHFETTINLMSVEKSMIRWVERGVL